MIPSHLLEVPFMGAGKYKGGTKVSLVYVFVDESSKISPN
jgi:hypothetical protein